MEDPVELDNASVQEILDLGGEELFADLVADFRSFAATAMEHLRAAAAAGDGPGVKEAAHSIKSTSKTLGAVALYDRLLAMEAAGAAGELTDVRDMLPGLESTLSATEVALVSRSEP